MITYHYMITTAPLQHIGHEFSCDRRTTSFFLVLPRIGKERNYSSYPLRTGDFTSMNHNAQFHQCSINGAATSIDDIDIVLPYGLSDAYGRFSDAIASYFGLGKVKADSKRGCIIINYSFFQITYLLAMFSASSG